MPESGVCVHNFGKDGVWYVCDMMYAVLYVRVSCFVVRGCAVSMSVMSPPPALCNLSVRTVVKLCTLLYG